MNNKIVESFQIKKKLLGGYKVIYKCPHCNEKLTSQESEISEEEQCPECEMPFYISNTATSKIELLRAIDDDDDASKLRSFRAKGRNQKIVIAGIGGIIVLGIILSAFEKKANNVQISKIDEETNNEPRAAEINESILKPKQSAPPVGFRGNIFLATYRIATEYSPGDKIQLDDELDKIEFKIKHEREKDVFNLFKFVLDIQTDLNELEIAKNVTEGVTAKFQKMSSNEKNGLKLLKPLDYDAMSEIETILNSGGVVVKSHLIPDLEKYTELLLKNELISTQESNGVAWVSYNKSKKYLTVAEEATLRVVHHMIHNNGKVLEETAHSNEKGAKEEPLTAKERDSMPSKFQTAYDLQTENKLWMKQNNVSDAEWREALREVSRGIPLSLELSYDDVRQHILRNR
tara:strand:+ start:11223 stop:12431 length:1209 start_codon:yes stop_codon:yes gene_type:complete